MMMESMLKMNYYIAIVPKMPRLIRDHNTSGDTIIYNPLYFGGPRTDIINIINIKAKYSC